MNIIVLLLLNKSGRVCVVTDILVHTAILSHECIIS